MLLQCRFAGEAAGAFFTGKTELTVVNAPMAGEGRGLVED